MLKNMAKDILTDGELERVKRVRRAYQLRRLRKLPPLSEREFSGIVTDTLGAARGDVLFIHSSVDQLHLGFPFHSVLRILKDVVGQDGTLLFPTFPKPVANQVFRRGCIFDVRKTPSCVGVLTELARIDRHAVRSLHPTKAVCAIGKHAREFVDSHHWVPRPYDKTSPFHRIMKYGGKILGLGVHSDYMSFVHCVEDHMGSSFPVRVYAEELFEGACIDYDGQPTVVKTYRHDRRKQRENISAFMAKHVDSTVCADLDVCGRKFFRADSRGVFEAMLSLAGEGKTIYPRFIYE